MNGDGTPDYGSCISKKRNAQAYWMIHSIVVVSFKPKVLTRSFFDTKTMKPLVTMAFSRALDIYKETTKYAPADEINLDVENERVVDTGRCTDLDWGISVLLPLKKGLKLMERQVHPFYQDPAGVGPSKWRIGPIMLHDVRMRLTESTMLLLLLLADGLEPSMFLQMRKSRMPLMISFFHGSGRTV